MKKDKGRDNALWFAFVRSIEHKSEGQLTSIDKKLRGILLANEDFARICPHCGETFLPRRGNQTYCKSVCQWAAKQARHRERQQKQMSLF